MSDWLFLIPAGIILLILGFFLIMFSMMLKKEDRLEGEINHEGREYKQEKIKGGGVILIGPVPIIFGSDKRFALIAMILAIILMLFAIFFFRPTI